MAEFPYHSFGRLTVLPSLIYCTCMASVVSLYLHFSHFPPFPYAGGYRAFFRPSATATRAKWCSCLQSYGMRSSDMLPLSLANWRNGSTTRSVAHQLLSLYSPLRSHNSPDTNLSKSLEPSTRSLFHSYTAPFSLMAAFSGSALKTVLLSTSGGSTINQTLRFIPLLSRAFTFWSTGLLIGDQSANRLTCLISRSAGHPIQMFSHTNSQLVTHFSHNSSSRRLGSAASRRSLRTQGAASIPRPTFHP